MRAPWTDVYDICVIRDTLDLEITAAHRRLRDEIEETPRGSIRQTTKLTKTVAHLKRLVEDRDAIVQELVNRVHNSPQYGGSHGTTVPIREGHGTEPVPGH